MKGLLFTTVIVAVIGLVRSAGALAGGDQNAYNNPTGDPPDDTYQTPYANTGDGRIMVFCAEGEVLVITPAEGGAVEASCLPAGD